MDPEGDANFWSLPVPAVGPKVALLAAIGDSFAATLNPLKSLLVTPPRHSDHCIGDPILIRAQPVIPVITPARPIDTSITLSISGRALRRR